MTAAPIDDPPTGDGLRVLVVDDSVDSADALAELLALDGHRVRRAYDGDAALAQARESSPQVAFVDLTLPGKNGFEIAAELRDGHGERDRDRVFLVALTGHDDDGARRRSAAAGFDLHLVKPITLLRLRAAVEAARSATRG